jgi:hypothetical protein
MHVAHPPAPPDSAVEDEAVVASDAEPEPESEEAEEAEPNPETEIAAFIEQAKRFNQKRRFVSPYRRYDPTIYEPRFNGLIGDVFPDQRHYQEMFIRGVISQDEDTNGPITLTGEVRFAQHHRVAAPYQGEPPRISTIDFGPPTTPRPPIPRPARNETLAQFRARQAKEEKRKIVIRGELPESIRRKTPRKKLDLSPPPPTPPLTVKELAWLALPVEKPKAPEPIAPDQRVPEALVQEVLAAIVEKPKPPEPPASDVDRALLLVEVRSLFARRPVWTADEVGDAILDDFPEIVAHVPWALYELEQRGYLRRTAEGFATVYEEEP